MIYTPTKIYDRNGKLIWKEGLGATTTSNFTTTATAATQLASSATNLANLVNSGDRKSLNDFGKATSKIATTAGQLAGIAAVSGVGLPVAAVLAAVAAVVGFVGAIFGSDEDEATLQEAAQVQQANTQLQLNNMLLDQKRLALQSAIDKSLPLLQQFSENNLKGFFTNGLGATSADALLSTAKSENQYLKDQQVKKMNNIATLIENFTNVVDSIANRNKYLFNMKQVQQYGSYASAAAALTALTLGVLKATKGDYKKGAIYGGAGLVGGALAYYLYTQSKIKSQVVAQSNAALQQYSVAINQATAEARFPTKDQLLKALATISFDGNEPAAINATYNQETGTWSRGDWRFQIINSEPVTAKALKNGSESFYYTTKYYVSKALNGFSNLLR